MNSIDIGIIVIVLGSAFIGLLRGFTREILGVFAWGFASLAAFISFPIVRHIARDQISNPLMADAATAGVIFIAFLVLFSLISHFLSGYVRDSALGGIDHSLGFSFGILRGLMMVCVLEIIMTAFVPRQGHAYLIQTARFTPLVYKGSNILLEMLPQSSREFLCAHAPQTQVQQQAQEVASSMMAQMTRPLIQIPPPSPPAILQPPATHVPVNEPPSVNPQATAADLAHVKPKAVVKEENGYNKSQRRDMERLLQSLD